MGGKGGVERARASVTFICLRATVHAHTIPNLKPEIWTKHCVMPFSMTHDSYFIFISINPLSLTLSGASSVFQAASS